jgi:chemotaxis signal transduction protein
MLSDLPSHPKVSSATDALSKRLGSLQQFQSRIADRIAQAQSEGNELESLLSIQVQGYRLLLPLAEVSELLPMHEITALPLAKRWVRGLAVVRSEVLTVLDLAVCLRALLENSKIHQGILSNAKTETRPSDIKLVVLDKAAANQLAFVADKIVGTIARGHQGLVAVKLDGEAAEFSKRFTAKDAYLKGVWRNEYGDMHLEMSLTAFLKSPDFTRIAIH